MEDGEHDLKEEFKDALVFLTVYNDEPKPEWYSKTAFYMGSLHTEEEYEKFSVKFRDLFQKNPNIVNSLYITQLCTSDTQLYMRWLDDWDALGVWRNVKSLFRSPLITDAIYHDFFTRAKNLKFVTINADELGHYERVGIVYLDMRRIIVEYGLDVVFRFAAGTRRALYDSHAFDDDDDDPRGEFYKSTMKRANERLLAESAMRKEKKRKRVTTLALCTKKKLNPDALRVVAEFV